MCVQKFGYFGSYVVYVILYDISIVVGWSTYGRAQTAVDKQPRHRNIIMATRGARYERRSAYLRCNNIIIVILLLRTADRSSAIGGAISRSPARRRRLLRENGSSVSATTGKWERGTRRTPKARDLEVLAHAQPGTDPIVRSSRPAGRDTLVRVDRFPRHRTMPSRRRCAVASSIIRIIT